MYSQFVRINIMTRINLVLPSILTDKHLMAEYRELPRIFTAVKKLIAQGKSPSDVDIPDNYVLGKGHVKFFYNKLFWLSERFKELFIELSGRGFKLDLELVASIRKGIGSIDNEWFGIYSPTPEEIYLNMARICKRSGINSVQTELDNA